MAADVIAQAQAAWNEANKVGDKAGMDAAHQLAEKARAALGFSGGADGTQKIAITPTNVQSNALTPEVIGQAKDAWKTVTTGGGFQTGIDPLGPKTAPKELQTSFSKYDSGPPPAGYNPNAQPNTNSQGAGASTSGTTTPQFNGMSELDYAKSIMAKATGGVNASYGQQLNTVQNNLAEILAQLQKEQTAVTEQNRKNMQGIDANQFSTTEKQKELMNQSGWNPNNSGLAVGELTRIGIGADKSRAEERAALAQKLADIEAGRTLAQTRSSNDTAGLDRWKSATLSGAEADAAIKADDRNYGMYRDTVGDYKDERNYNRDVLTSDRNYNRDVLTSDRSYNAEQGQVSKENAWTEQDRATVAADKEKQAYIDSVKGLGDQFNFVDEIKKILGDGDPSNDYKASALQVEKKYREETKLQNDIKTIGQYSSDFQDEINKRTASNPNDPIIPYLKVARADKLSKMADSQLSLEEALQKRAMDIFKETGSASGWVAEALGLKEGTKTAEFEKILSDSAIDSAKAKDESDRGWANIGIQQQNADTAKDKAKSSSNDKTTKEEVNQSFGEDYRALKSKSYYEAKKELEDGADMYISYYGVDGYTKLYNMVMADAIKYDGYRAMGDATPQSITTTTKKQTADSEITTTKK